ncbi:MAG: class I SAM-dependent RNA methyltransferase [Bdellovibrionota bacterium]
METVLEIIDLARSGAGLGRDASGRVVFVPFTAPGDRVRIEIVSEEKRYAEARLLEILTPSPLRVPAPCPVFGRCGGCEWQHLPYERQWEAKKKGLQHALERVGVKTESTPWDEFPAEKIWEYRNRIQLRGFGNEIGFYARGSNTLVPVEKCFIARPELNERIPAAREAGKDRPREYKLELEVFPGGEVTESWNSGHSARGFRQVHDEQNEKLRGWVRSHCGTGGTLLDLYGGSGNLSLGLADQFALIHCVDVGAPIRTPEGAPSHMQFHRMPVFDWLKREQVNLRGAGPMRLVLDPPREGLGPDLFGIVEILKTLPVEETLLIGCETDPWTHALARFLKHGWKLERLGALDFFPQTHHVEALAVLRR